MTKIPEVLYGESSHSLVLFLKGRREKHQSVLLLDWREAAQYRKKARDNLRDVILVSDSTDLANQPVWRALGGISASMFRYVILLIQEFENDPGKVRAEVEWEILARLPPFGIMAVASFSFRQGVNIESVLPNRTSRSEVRCMPVFWDLLPELTS